MQIDLIFRIAAVGILVAVLNTLLARSGREEQGLMVVIVGLIMVVMLVLREVVELFELVQELFGF